MTNIELSPISNQSSENVESSNIDRVEWSEAQKAQQERFKQAADHARAVMSDPNMRAVYEVIAEQKYMRPCTVAFIDHFKWINLLSCE